MLVDLHDSFSFAHEIHIEFECFTRTAIQRQSTPMPRTCPEDPWVQ